MCELSQILRAVERGDAVAAQSLLPLVYNELRRLAASQIAREKPGQTLQATALVHEAYLRLVGGQSEDSQLPLYDDRGHFFAAAAEAMRRILVERARRKGAIKHGGQRQRLEFDERALADEGRPAELLALDEALTELEQQDVQAAQLVKLRYFAGLTHQEAAQSMQIPRRTADRLWALAKVWLYRRLKEQ